MEFKTITEAAKAYLEVKDYLETKAYHAFERAVECGWSTKKSSLQNWDFYDNGTFSLHAHEFGPFGSEWDDYITLPTEALESDKALDVAVKAFLDKERREEEEKQAKKEAKKKEERRRQFEELSKEFK